MPAPRFLPRELISPRQFTLLTTFSVIKAVGLVLVAYALGVWIAAMAQGENPETVLLYVAGCGAVVRAVAAWGLNVASRRMGLGVKERLRKNLVQSQAAHPSIVAQSQDAVPVVATLASHGIEKLDDYFTKFIPALIGAVAVPLLVGLYNLKVDWVSAIILLLTVPLVPVFMALIGMHTQDTLSQSQASLDRLASQLYELAQGLPALLGLGRAREHGNAIAKVGEKYRAATMANLKTVFMSSFWLELISTLSVAVLAVFIGVRLVNGSMELSAGLTILILAPEVFSALREVGSAYHAADDGLAAFQRYAQMTTKPSKSGLKKEASASAGNILEIEKLTLRYQDGAEVYKDFDLALAAGERHIIATPSGTGKTTLLTLVAEAYSSDNTFDPALVQGAIRYSGSIAAITQHPRFDASTGSEQIAQDAPLATGEMISDLATHLSLYDLLARNIAEYSPGELRRLEVMRALLRVHSEPDCTLLLADEPTAHLDQHNAEQIRGLLKRLPERCAVLIASHDPLIEQSPVISAPVTTAGTVSEVAEDLHRDNEDYAATQGTTTPFAPRTELLKNYLSARKAVLWGSISVLCAAALAALSGWLIVEASYQPPILHLSVAFVMVRALGIGRAAFRYLEQLAIHDAVLGYAGKLREKMWNAMIADPSRWGLFSRSSVVLRFLLAEVDELRDQLARVLFPPLSAITLWVLSTVALFIIQPEFGWVATLAGLVLVFPVRWLVRRVEGQQLVKQMNHRFAMNQSIVSILRHKSALRINQSLKQAIKSLDTQEQANTMVARRHALGQGTASALAVFFSVLMAVVITSMSHSTASMTALAVLLSLALGDSAGNALMAVQQGASLKHLTKQLEANGLTSRNSHPMAQKQATDELRAPVVGYELQDVGLGYGSAKNVVSELSAQIPPGQWTAIVGPSGAGKSTLLTALLGALPVRSGQLYGVDATGHRQSIEQADLSSVAWCPQEAHLFDSSIRRNLMLGVPENEERTDDQLIAVLQQIGLSSWYQNQSNGLETKIGSGGHNLSGGQRCKLAVARAILGGHQVILLDEPTAHLGVDESEELIDTLRQALATRTVVLITHDEKLAQECDHSIDLGVRSLAR